MRAAVPTRIVRLVERPPPDQPGGRRRLLSGEAGNLVRRERPVVESHLVEHPLKRPAKLEPSLACPHPAAVDRVLHRQLPVHVQEQLTRRR